MSGLYKGKSRSNPASEIYGPGPRKNVRSLPEASEKYYPAGTDLSYINTTAKEEQALFRKMKSGDGAARERLVKNHLLFAANTARRIARGKLPENEIISAANYAIMKALDRFNPDRGFRFTTFLRFYIISEIATLWRSKNPVDYKSSADFPEGPIDVTSKPLETQVEDHPLEAAEHAEYMKAVVLECADSLTAKENDLLKKIYQEGKSLADIARSRGITRSGIQKSHVQILKKLRAAMAAKGINSL